MADAVLWTILETVRDVLRNNLVFQAMGDDDVETIDPKNITIEKVAIRQRESDRVFAYHETPGIVLSTPSSIITNPNEGENARDDVRYPVLFQVIDKDNQERIRGLRTYLKWIEQITKAFRNQPLPCDPLSVWNAEVRTADIVNEGLWVNNGLFVAAITITFVSRETRGLT